MKVIEINLVNDAASLVTLVRDNDDVILPVVNEVNLAAAILELQTLHINAKQMHFVTDAASTIKSITLQHSTVELGDSYEIIYFSDRMRESTKPDAGTIAYFEALAAL